MGVAETVNAAWGDGWFAGHPLVYAYALVDLPFSCLADSLFLPYTLPVWLRDRFLPYTLPGWRRDRHQTEAALAGPG